MAQPRSGALAFGHVPGVPGPDHPGRSPGPRVRDPVLDGASGGYLGIPLRRSPPRGAPLHRWGPPL